MPNQLPTAERPYHPLFAADRFYLLPLPWLHAISEPGALDARELLLAHVVDSLVIFEHKQIEQHWHQESAQGRPFFTRRTYERHRKSLFIQGLLYKYTPPPRPDSVTQAAWQDLQRGIKYATTQWPAHAWIYRPRSYLENRWPVWLGNAGIATRFILLALLAELVPVVDTAGAILPQHISLTWQRLCAFVEAHWTVDDASDASVTIRSKLRKGIQELKVLQAIEEVPGSPLRYQLTLTVFDQLPRWSLPAMAHSCQADIVKDEPWLEVVRDLMHYCWEPVTRLKRVWNAVQAQRQSAYLLDETDLLDFQKFLRIQRGHNPPPRHDHLLQSFIQQRQRIGEQRLGDPFILIAQEIALARLTVEGVPIYMPTTTTHELTATQLWVFCERADELTVEESQLILAQTRLIIWQQPTEGLPILIPLVCHPPRALSIDFGYTLRANQLHRQLDYGRPFEVILHSERPDPRLKLICRFRLFFKQRKQST